MPSSTMDISLEWHSYLGRLRSSSSRLYSDSWISSSEAYSGSSHSRSDGSHSVSSDSLYHSLSCISPMSSSQASRSSGGSHSSSSLSWWVSYLWYSGKRTHEKRTPYFGSSFLGTISVMITAPLLPTRHSAYISHSRICFSRSTPDPSLTKNRSVAVVWNL